MGSLVAWMDFSEEHQQKIYESIKGFESKDTVDDLGFGSIRDAISGILFPGTSVLQTRARYFLFIPWIFQEAYRKHPKKMVAKARDLELRLIGALSQADDTSGVIGIQRGLELKTVPSSIYWSGLQKFGIFKLQGRSIQQFGKLVMKQLEDTEFEGEFVGSGSPFWCELPPAPGNFTDFSFAELKMTGTEARWLAERIITTSSVVQPNLLSYLLREITIGRESFSYDSQFVWELSLPEATDERLSQLITHGKHFSQLAHISSLLYNAMLIEKLTNLGRDITFADDYEQRLENQIQNLNESSEFLSWCKNIEQFWSCLASLGAVPAQKSINFVRELAMLIEQHGLDEFANRLEVRQLIKSREIQHKGKQARLEFNSRLFAYQGEAGTGLMTYRWDLVKRLLQDIEDGLKREFD
jgi:hypothetical protein